MTGTELFWQLASAFLGSFGFAILFHVLPDVGPVYSVSIIPTGGAGVAFPAGS